MTAIAVIVIAVVVMFAAAAVPAQAQTPTVLYRFAGFNGDACSPRGNIVQGRDGNMYGGGAAACGTGSGTIYKISPAGVESAFFIFPQQWLNCGGAGLTLGSDGNFYGACESGNPATGMGSIFRLTPAGVFTDLHDFTGANGDSLPVYPPIQASDGNFYGVSGNEVQVCGNIYKLTPAGVYKNLHTFTFGSECHSSNLFQASDGNLYGTLANCTLPGSVGCVYRISTAGAFKEIHGFAVTTGNVPCTGLIQGKDGKLYGATQQGAANGNGNIYKMTTAGVATDLHDFTNATDASCVNNVGPPVNLLQVADGSFYGVNPAYGPNGTGSIYKLTSANVFSAFQFPNPPVDGDLPSSTLIQNTNGLVYGTTPSGGGGTCFGGACFGTFFSVATGDKPFVNLEPTERTGNVGASVGMFGQGFSSASVVKFGGVAATSVTRSGTTYLTAVVPAGAHTGPVTATTGTTTLTSPQTYKVKPKITSFSPSSGSAGTLVTIYGSGLIQTTAVKFGAVKATTFTVVSDSKVTAVVPSGLAAGAVTISITTPGGTANSPTKFTVN
ncbi:MAG: choice-of-anchor tandem repeat GloVer-containing protein [Terriglobales bacterium]